MKSKEAANYSLFVIKPVTQLSQAMRCNKAHGLSY